MFLNYDQLWEEHDGEVYDEWFYQLPLESKRRAMEDIKRPKRKMYRDDMNGLMVTKISWRNH
ncbi:DUF535 family protein [Photobacterium damselae]|nr:DUF535 family protein [Photobacterium damselae]MCG9705649.1 VirK/YbjX family protein [Photobacterium damselae]